MEALEVVTDTLALPTKHSPFRSQVSSRMNLPEHPLVRGEVKERNSPFGGSLFPNASQEEETNIFSIESINWSQFSPSRSLFGFL
jgi:hypothetical protein